ncbi:fructose-bisphosphate aldolase [Patescibacteria group bacterium]|nr:fructose-bisphosphate aldolase [Patescibacteria group bacterium]
MILPIDQGLEHGPTDFLVNPDCGDPEYQLRLAKEGGYSAIALQIGLAKKYWSKPEYKKYVPLVLKLNGKTCIPGDDRPFSPLNSSVEEAEKLGADAVGYTLYVGSARQDEDFLQFRQVRQEAAKYDIPVIVWAYPRGEQINANGGKNSLAAVDYAVRAAMELGADVVKFNWPEFPKNGFAKGSCFEEYNTLSDLNRKERLTKVVQTAGALGAILSGGSRVSDKELLEHVRTAMEVGMDGIIFGRNEWQREYKSALLMSTKIREILLA